MADRSLKAKATKIQNREYVLVKDRVIYFNDTYSNGRILTELLTAPDSDQVVIKATVTPDVAHPERHFTGYSQAVVGEGMVNKTAALENAETSAVGRALGMMGIGVIDSIASVDEMRKAQYPAKPAYRKPVAAPAKQETPFEKAKAMIAAANQPEVLEGLRERIEASEAFTQAEQHQLKKLIDAKAETVSA